MFEIHWLGIYLSIQSHIFCFLGGGWIVYSYKKKFKKLHTNLWSVSVLYNLCSADGNGFTLNLSFPNVCHFNNLTGKFIALISHTVAQGKRYWGNCLYMPCEVHFWGSVLPECYIVTNISVMSRKNKAVCVCVYMSLSLVCMWTQQHQSGISFWYSAV